MYNHHQNSKFNHSGYADQTCINSLNNSPNHSPLKKAILTKEKLRHLSPDISPKGAVILNYRDTKSTRNTFLQKSTIKNIEARNLKPTVAVKLDTFATTTTAGYTKTISSSVSNSRVQTPIRACRLGDQHIERMNSPLQRRDTSSKVELPERMVKTLENYQKARIEGMNTGKEGLLAILHEKELENQVQILENRIVRLQVEEENLRKKIDQTAKKTEKVLESKVRHHEKLIHKEEQQELKRQQVVQLKGEISNQREIIKVSLRQKTEHVLKKKSEVASSVKDIVKEAKMQRIEKESLIYEKNYNLIQKMREVDKTSKLQRTEKDVEKKQEQNEKYKTKINEHKERTEKLEMKLKELEEKEEVLVERLKHTYSLHEAKFNEFQRAFKAKVDSKKPIDKHTLLLNEYQEEDDDQQQKYEEDHEGYNMNERE